MDTSEWVYHAKRYWVQEPRNGQHSGWNTDFEPCPVFKKTAKRVGILSPTLGVLWLNREALDRDGRVYHSKPHEYFYAVRPAVDPEKPKYNGGGVGFMDLLYLMESSPFQVLELTAPCSKADVKRAYRRLAKSAHPDTGGDHSSFIRLNEAYEAAMRLATA